ncbi:PAS domain S-box protein [Castellaniella denitrificans]|uniref:sensor histidine kinase n=1 Tax=Castellaniella denitrificans TaxID=56119 RepID=UPI00361FA08D
MNARPTRLSFTRRGVLLWLVPMMFVLLILASLLWLPGRARQMEADERQEQLIADTLWLEQTIRFQLGRNEDNLRLMANEIAAGVLSDERLRARMDFLGRSHPELMRIVRLDADGRIVAASGAAGHGADTLPPPSPSGLERARGTRTPQYGQPAPPPGRERPVLMDYYVPLFQGDRYLGSLVATYSVAGILEQMVPWWFAQDNEILLIDRHENVLGLRAAGGPGRGVYTHSRDLHLPYADITLRTNSVKSAPHLLPNLLVGSVIALSLGLIWSLAALWRDINRRMAAEDALRAQAAFRAAMEDSLVTGLRARDLEGRMTYVNPAFCRMVGMPAEELVGRLPPMPYWAPEAMNEYEQRLAERKAGVGNSQGFETVFQRSDGERIPVLVYESPLLDDSGRQTGWMGSILDISDRRRFEELNRRQQEKLQASARLATMGEIASTLAHELNQPLAAISSYTTGALNLLEGNARLAGVDGIGPIKMALEKANVQIQRAGHIIRSVHTFVKRREPKREPVDLAALIADVIQLVELQANQYFVTIQTEIEPGLPQVLADPAMLEQVLLNLTRNAIEAMRDVEPARRLLRIGAGVDPQARGSVAVSVADRGHGIAPEVGERLFSPFFSTKADGMGMGLKICRTTIEFHGGTLAYRDNPGGGTVFHFSLPVRGASASA